MGDPETKTMTETEALAWLAEVFQEPAEKIMIETPRDSIATWDSLGVLTLMAELDEKFDLVTSDQEMREMARVGDVLSLLREKGKLRP
jgi:acyl carrier protein